MRQRRRTTGAVLVVLLLGILVALPALAEPVAARARTVTHAPAVAAVDAPTVHGLVDLVSPLVDGSGEEVGTGIVVSDTGLVVTNAHVVAGAMRTRARDVDSGDRHPARVVARDAAHDLAVLQVQDAEDLTVAPIGTAVGLRRGDPVAAVGNAGGGNGDPVVTTGTVTDLGRSITATDDDGSNPENLTGLIQVSAQVRPGDSGGALVDRSGRVVGITTASGRGAGFAIPIDQALAYVRAVTSADDVQRTDDRTDDHLSDETDASAADHSGTKGPW